MICFRDRPPFGKGSGMPCGACREFLMQLDQRNADIQIMDNYEKRTIVKLGDLMPNWWGQIKMVDPSSEDD